MKYRVDKKTGNKLSILGFGCMRLPGKRGSIDINASKKLIHKAIDEGINYFDTAYLYPGSETALGESLKNGLREKVYIADKLPLVLCRNSKDLDRFFNKQLERLQTDHIDYYLMHMLPDVGRWEKLKEFEIEKWIEEKKKSGQIVQAGFSFHGGQDEFLKLLDVYNWDFCQIQYNYVDENRQAGKTGLLKAASMDMPVIIMEPLLGGKLANGLPQSAVDIFKNANPEYSPAGWALRWIWNQSEPTLLLSGMNSEAQLDENLRIANSSEPNMLTESEIETYKEVLKKFNESFKVPCTGCRYCMPCPFGVDIPTCFAAYNTVYTIGKSSGFQQYLMSTGGLSSNQHYASLCKKCGKCEEHCPQSIPIRKSLEEVSRRLEPFWFKPAMAIARTFTGTKKKSSV